MAKEAKPAAAEGEAPPKKSKKLIIIIAAVVVVLLIAGGIGAYFLMGRSSSEEGDDEEVAAAHDKKGDTAKKGEHAAPVYVALETFTVNLVPEDGEHFLQVIMNAEVEDAKVGEELKTNMPKLRNDIMMLLSSKTASEVLTKEGKQTLADAIRTQMNEVLAPKKKGDGPVKSILFTSFIIQ